MNSKLLNKKSHQLELAIQAENHARALREEAQRLHEAVEAGTDLQAIYTEISIKLANGEPGGIHPDLAKQFFRALGDLLGTCKQDELQMVLVQIFNGYITKKVPQE